MKIISDNNELKGSLLRAFAKECPDVTFVDATYENAYEVALNAAQYGMPVIVLGIRTPEEIVDLSSVRKIMCKKNVGYLQVPFVLEDVKATYKQLQRGKKLMEDVFAQELQVRYDSFQAKPGRDISLAFVTIYGHPECLADILQTPSQRYLCL